MICVRIVIPFRSPKRLFLPACAMCRVHVCKCHRIRLIEDCSPLEGWPLRVRTPMCSVFLLMKNINVQEREGGRYRLIRTVKNRNATGCCCGCSNNFRSTPQRKVKSLCTVELSSRLSRKTRHQPHRCGRARARARIQSARRVCHQRGAHGAVFAQT